MVTGSTNCRAATTDIEEALPKHRDVNAIGALLIELKPGLGDAPAKVAASLLENGDEDSHVEEIDHHLAHATHVIYIVAFAKYTGWELIKQALGERAAKGLKATFVIGLNFYQSEPVVLRGIRRLHSKAKASGGEIKLYIEIGRAHV